MPQMRCSRKRFCEKLVEEKKAENAYAGTKTEKNLAAAFAGESQARNKYTYFAQVAKPTRAMSSCPKSS